MLLVIILLEVIAIWKSLEGEQQDLFLKYLGYVEFCSFDRCKELIE